MLGTTNTLYIQLPATVLSTALPIRTLQEAANAKYVSWHGSRLVNLTNVCAKSNLTILLLTNELNLLSFLIATTFSLQHAQHHRHIPPTQQHHHIPSRLPPPSLPRTAGTICGRGKLMTSRNSSPGWTKPQAFARQASRLDR